MEVINDWRLVRTNHTEQTTHRKYLKHEEEYYVISLVYNVREQTYVGIVRKVGRDVSIESDHVLNFSIIKRFLILQCESTEGEPLAIILANKAVEQFLNEQNP